MDASWRMHQIDHNRRARGKLTEGEDGSFRDWEVVMVFCEIVIAAGGYAEMRCMPAPKSRRARQALVERHLPHLAESYCGLYGLSLGARYCQGHGMTENAWRKAKQCHGIPSKSIPAQ